MSDDYGQFTIIDNYTTIKKENKTILPDYINNPEYYYLDDYNTLKKKMILIHFQVWKRKIMKLYNLYKLIILEL